MGVDLHAALDPRPQPGHQDRRRACEQSTVNLSVDFVGFAKVGQWLEIRPEVIKTGKSLCFASALVLADDTVCARASAVFQGGFRLREAERPPEPRAGAPCHYL